MEEPRAMLSDITQTDYETIISTPKKKSWAAIFFLALFTLQFLNGLFQSLFFARYMPLSNRLIISLISCLVLYFTIRGLLWQFKGVKKIQIRKDELEIIKESPFWYRSKIYRIPDLKSVDVKDEWVSQGPMAMMQLLGIVDRVKITFKYGYDTITANGGMDISEAIKIRDLIKSKIGLD